MSTSTDPFDIETGPAPGDTALSPLRVGNRVLIRAVTFYYTGQIASLTRDEVVLSDAAWVPATGRFASMLLNGLPEEVEPYPSGVLVSIGRGAIVDASDWKHALPRVQK